MRISKSNHLRRLLRVQDALIGVAALALAVNGAWWLGFANLDDTLNHLVLLPFALLFSLVASSGRTAGLRGQDLPRIVWFSLRHAAIVVIGLLAVAYFAKLDFVSRYSLAAFGAMLAGALTVNRLFLRWWYFRGRQEKPDNFLKVLVIGSGNRARNLMRAYRDNSEWGVSFIGMLDPSPSCTVREVDGVPMLGSVSAIRDILATQVVDEVVICLPRSLIDNIEEVIDACGEQAVCIKFLADVYDIPEGGAISLEMVGGWPVLNLDPVAHDESKLVVKRVVDLLITIPALLVLLPFFAVIAVLIKLESPGTVFFKQPRVGLNKRTFRMIKFRSMYQDAEQRLAEIEHLNEAEGPIFKIANDPRVTRVGRFLRKTSIDELPQLFNVLLGHMSLVGPRPMSLRDVSRFSLGIQRRRFSVRPGLACLREVSGRSRLSFDRWLELDLKYIDEWSLWLDIKILVKLIPSVIRGDGAS
ncbi:MAG: sugar transferase [Pseudomonadales bacterium]|nr:sugar transferase [Pseudomonadales bacterium]